MSDDREKDDFADGDNEQVDVEVDERPDDNELDEREEQDEPREDDHDEGRDGEDGAPPVNDRARGEDEDDDPPDLEAPEEDEPQVDREFVQGAKQSSASTDADETESEGPDDDDDQAVAALGDKTGKPKWEDGNEKPKKRRGLILLAIVLAFFVLLLILGLLFRRDNEDLDSRQVAANPTASPTISPVTIVPTAFVAPTRKPTSSPIPGVAPTTDSPTTGAPTAGAPTTSSPTSSGIPPLGRSELPCEGIKKQENVTAGNRGEGNFKPYAYTTNDGEEVQICGDTYAGFDPERPKLNFWSVRYGRRDCRLLDWYDGNELCLSIGARRCSLNELRQLVAQGTGCGGDRTLLYTGSSCQAGGNPGAYMFNVGLNTTREGYTFCETDLSKPSILRCCGDNF